MRHSYLIFIILVYASCIIGKDEHKCSTSREYSVKETTHNFQEIRISPIRPNLTAIIGSRIHRQIEIINDSLLVSQYQDHLFPKYYTIDRVDSLIITGGLNKRAYVFNLKDDSVHNLKTRKVTSIYPKEDEILLFGYDGFYKVDKNTYKKVKDKKCPVDYFSVHKPTFEKDTLYFDNDWVYAIKTDRWIPLEANKKKKKRKTLGEITTANKDGFWHTNKLTYIKNNPRSVTSDTFDLGIPNITNITNRYTLSHDHIWIHNNNQVYFINTENKKKYSANLDYNRLIGFEIKNCEAYIILNDQIIIKPLKNIIDEGILFEVVSHSEEVKSYNETKANLVDSRELTIIDAICVIDSINNRFRNSSNQEIQNKLTTLSDDIMRKVKFEKEETHLECYRNKNIALTERQKCINQLIIQLGVHHEYDKIRSLNDEYFTLFPTKESGDFSIQKSLNRITQYGQKNDSLKAIKIPIDELHYQKALLKELLCYAPWNCHGGCGGCDLSLPIESIEKFILDYPNSQYIEAASWKLLCLRLEYYEIDQYYIDRHREFINKFPNGQYAKLAKEKIFVSQRN